MSPVMWFHRVNYSDQAMAQITLVWHKEAQVDLFWIRIQKSHLVILILYMLKMPIEEECKNTKTLRPT